MRNEFSNLTNDELATLARNHIHLSKMEYSELLHLVGELGLRMKQTLYQLNDYEERYGLINQ